MVLGGRRIVPVPVPHVYALHEAQTIQEIHGAIDAGQADPRRHAQCPAVHLSDLEVRPGGSHDLENGLASLC